MKQSWMKRALIGASIAMCLLAFVVAAQMVLNPPLTESEARLVGNWKRQEDPHDLMILRRDFVYETRIDGMELESRDTTWDADNSTFHVGRRRPSLWNKVLTRTGLIAAPSRPEYVYTIEIDGDNLRLIGSRKVFTYVRSREANATP